MKRLRVSLAISILLISSAAVIRASIPPAPPLFDYETFRLAHPINAPYWSPAFVYEYRSMTNDISDNGYWQMGNIATAHYHVTNGRRLVVGAPANAPHTLWLFGNSGLFDPWLPDNLTAASDLQSLLGASWKVVDQAANGQVIDGEVQWLRDTPIRAGDIVLFIDGAMEPKPVDVLHYNTLIAKARAYAQSHGATFVHFLQPYSVYLAYAGMDGVRLDVPPQDFIETAHMNSIGAAVEAQEIYDALTIF